MKVTFKTIAQGTFKLEVNEDQTVLEVKNAIASKQEENKFPVERQKLIYDGKVLEDAQLFDSLNYDAKKFIVLILSAEKKTESAPSKASEELSALAKGLSEVSVASSSQPSSAETAPEIPEQTSQPLPPENQEKLNNLVAMGYPESEALNALRAAFFNQPRAVDYLINSIPDTTSAVVNETSTEKPNEEVPGLEFLQDNESFIQICAMVRQNPEILPEVIQQISQHNPTLMQLIRDNETEFLGLLNSNDTISAIAPQGSGRQVIDVTAEEHEAINRLKGMGFPEQLVIEAYIACDKNEELAVNYILARMSEN